MRITRRKGLAVLLATAITLAIIAVVALVALLALRRESGAAIGWQDPLTKVMTDEIVPQLALYPLAGASEVETIDAGIDNGDLATAYAGLVHCLDISGRQRIGRLAALGDRATKAGKPDLASVIYQQVYDLALLSPELNDPQRADALWRAARGWKEAGQDDQALLALEQAELLATRSPFLQAAQRRSILVLLEEAYRDLGDEDRAEAVRGWVVDLDQQNTREPTGTRAGAAELPSRGEPVSSPEVGALEEARRQAAYAVIESLSQADEPDAELVRVLADALMAEDAAKLSLYGQELGASTQAGRRSELHQLLIRWLLLKRRVAQRGFGLSIIPDWEAQSSDIQASLSRAYEDLAFDYEDWSASLPDATQMVPSSYAALRSIILAGRLGQYPNPPEDQLVQKLSTAVVSLVAAGYTGDLYLSARESGSELELFLSSGSDTSSTP